MSTYDKMAPKYDQMINWKARLEKETPFLQRLFNEKRINKVMDLACGSGHHAKLFHKWGCEVVGVDPSEAMISLAREGTEELEDIKFVQADFLNFNESVDSDFHAVFSMGNSLPHLKTRDDLKKTLQNIFDSLKPDGVFVFQNRNYDRLMETKERFLFPTTHRTADKEQIFFRFNDFEDDIVRFNIVNFTRVGEKGWLHEVLSTELYPWRQKEMEAILREVGFVALNFYGDFSGMPFQEKTSTDLVGLVRKPKADQE